MDRSNQKDAQMDLDRLKSDLLKTQRRMKRAKKKSVQKKLNDKVNSLKCDLGWAFLERGAYETGFAIFSSVSGRKYEESKCGGKGGALTGMGRYDEARRILEGGLREFPTSYILIGELGCLFGALGDNMSALRCFERVLELAPYEHPGILYNKALVLAHMGSYRDAVPILDRLIKEDSTPMYLAERGYCALQMGDPREAIQYYDKAKDLLERMPSSEAGVCIYTGLCTVYTDLGMRKEAMEIALEGVNRFPDGDPALFFNLANTFVQMGWRDEARKVLKAGLEKFPQGEELAKFLEEVEEDTDDPDNDGKSTVLRMILLLASLGRNLRRRRRS
jgi:tetratricopeptide (TPR) repeat protein